eukprot:6741135-Prymnesium_polylepis.1
MHPDRRHVTRASVRGCASRGQSNAYLIRRRSRSGQVTSRKSRQSLKHVAWCARGSAVPLTR